MIIGQVKTRGCDGREMGVGPFLSLFHEDFKVELKEMWTAQVCDGLRAAIGMALYFQKHGRVHGMFSLVFVGNKLSVEYATVSSYVQKVFCLELRRMESFLGQALVPLSPLQLQFYFLSSVFL